MGLKLTFGLRLSDQRYVDVGAVPNGAKCGCVCPACNCTLVAKNAGNQKISHFAHKADFEGALETVLHETAKQIVRELGFVWLPESILAAKTQFFFTGHTLEVKFDRVIPDVTVWQTEARRLAVGVGVRCRASAHTEPSGPTVSYRMEHAFVQEEEKAEGVTARRLQRVGAKCAAEDRRGSGSWLFLARCEE